MKIRILEGPHVGKILDLRNEEFIIGRDKECTLQLDVDGVSRKHCRIFREGAILIIEDNDSTNGIRVNGEKVKRKTLAANDKIRIGKSLIMLSDDRDIIEESAISNFTFEGSETAETENDNSGKAILAAVIVVVLVLGGLFALINMEEVDPEEVVEISNSNKALNQLDAEEEIPLDPVAKSASPVPQDEDEDEEEEEEEEEKPEEAIIEMHSYMVKSNPSGADVIINGETVGQTPYVMQDLPEGAHAIELKKTDYAIKKEVIQVPVRDVKTIDLELEAGIGLIRSTPSNMAVSRGHQVIGKTPFKFKAGTGKYEFKLSGVGYNDEDVEIFLNKFKASIKEVRMDKSTGTLSIRVMPSGAVIFIDGFSKGKALGEVNEFSKPKTLHGLKGRGSRIWAEYDGKMSQIVMMTIKSGQHQNLKLVIEGFENKAPKNKVKVKVKKEAPVKADNPIEKKGGGAVELD
ncbi:MAG: PEGA domain-containing protein [Lentisphaeria bacterium]|nr:PEGA domain-containing protein [Lentisphaeria bacterium]NQZ69720.1 PEGA domain-containing protein [Lentisphaeria bacterium]